MPQSTQKPAYQSPAVDLTIGLATGPLASSAGLTAGRESLLVDNSTNRYDDYRINGYVCTGTTPTVNTRIEIWPIPKLSLATPAFPDTFGGADASVTVTSRNVLLALCKRGPAWQAIVSATSNVKYPVDFSLLEYFGGLWIPQIWSLFVVHNTAVALNATGSNHILSATGLYLQNE